MAAPIGHVIHFLKYTGKRTPETIIRYFSSFRDIKKFYKTTSISQSEDQFEINLDTRKLRTPSGHLFRVPSEPLALAVASEWNIQHEIIKPHSMYLTSLCHMAIDNPTQRSHDDIIHSVIHFLSTDTICYRVSEPDSLAEMQRKQWDPVLDWFNERYQVFVEPTTSMICPQVSQSAKHALHTHLSSYTQWSLNGFVSAVETLKSLILTMAAVDKNISVDTALHLSRLETNFQTDHWGTVEWHHDIDYHESRARLAAAMLFIHFCTETMSVKSKIRQL